MEDKKISDAVELLLKGAKMLAYHCPECSMPLFLHEGKVICPSCKKEAEIVESGREVTVRLKEETEVGLEEGKKERIEVEKETVAEFEEEERPRVKRWDLEGELKKVLRKYIERLANDYDSAEQTIRIINGIIEIIEKIRRLNI